MPRRLFPADSSPVPEEFRCRRSDGRGWRCSGRSLPGLTLCVHHHRRNRSKYSANPSPSPNPNTTETVQRLRRKRKRKATFSPPATPPHRADGRTARNARDRTEGRKQRGRKRKTKPSQPPPDELRCRRSDGKQWRCTDLAVPGLCFCQHHYSQVQAKLRRYAGKDPTGSPPRKRQREVAEEEGLIGAETRRKSERRRARTSSPATAAAATAEEETRELPNGVMTISPSSGGAPASGNPASERKLGLGLGFEAGPILLSRTIRSKNAEPIPLGTVKKFPGGKALKKGKKRACHMCGEGEAGPTAQCSICMNLFCSSCINQWYSELSRTEIKQSCPICRGICSCESCGLGQNNNHDSTQKVANGEPKVVKIKYANYLFSQLLPVLKKIKTEQLDELEIEAIIQGTKISSVPVQVMETNRDELLTCNSCDGLIHDLLRSCPNCSYKLCLTCCQNLRAGTTTGTGTETGTEDLTNHCNRCSRMSDYRPKCSSCVDSTLNLVYLLPVGWSDELTVGGERKKINSDFRPDSS